MTKLTPLPTVLNVDDSEDDVVMLKAACESAKVTFRFHAVSEGEEAVSYVRGFPPYSDRDRHPFPALVLLDLKMPGTSGFDVLKAIRGDSDPTLRRLRVVVFTSSMHEQDAVRAFQSGADAYLVKPSDFGDLRHMVKTIDGMLAHNEIDLSVLRDLPDALLAPAAGA